MGESMKPAPYVTVTITRDAGGGYIVEHGDRNSGVLTLGEMLEQVMWCLGVPDRGPYPMLTDEEVERMRSPEVWVPKESTTTEEPPQ